MLFCGVTIMGEDSPGGPLPDRELAYGLIAEEEDCAEEAFGTDGPAPPRLGCIA